MHPTVPRIRFHGYPNRNWITAATGVYVVKQTKIVDLNQNKGPQFLSFLKGQTPKSDTPPNIAPKIVTPENYLQIWDSSATLIGQLAIVTLLGAILDGIPLSGAYPQKIDTDNTGNI